MGIVYTMPSIVYTMLEVVYTMPGGHTMPSIVYTMLEVVCTMPRGPYDARGPYDVRASYIRCYTMPWGHTMLYNALGSYFCCLLPSHIHITRFPYENVFISFCPRLGLNSDVWNLKLGPTKWATLKQWCPINFLISSKSYQKCVFLVLRESARIFLCYSFVGCFYSTSKDEFKCVSQNK